MSKAKSSRLSLAIAERLKKHDLYVDPVIYRTRAGRHQKAAGAWLWFMKSTSRSYTVGSQTRVTELMRCPGWTVEKDSMDIHIDPA